MPIYTRIIEGGVIPNKLHRELANSEPSLGFILDGLEWEKDTKILKLNYSGTLSTSDELTMDFIINTHDSSVLLNGELITPILTSKYNNNWAPDKILDATTVKVSSDNNKNELTGISDGLTIKTIRLFNIGPKKFKIKNNSGKSLPSNRILCPSKKDVNVDVNGLITLEWFVSDSKWVVTGFNK